MVKKLIRRTHAQSAAIDRMKRELPSSVEVSASAMRTVRARYGKPPAVTQPEDERLKPTMVTVPISVDVMQIIKPWIEEENGTLESFVSGCVTAYVALRLAEGD